MEAVAQWASLSHRLLVRQDIRNKHRFLNAAMEHPNCSVRTMTVTPSEWSGLPWNIPPWYANWSARYTLKTYGHLLQTLRQHTDPLSARDILSYCKR